MNCRTAGINSRIKALICIGLVRTRSIPARKHSFLILRPHRQSSLDAGAVFLFYLLLTGFCCLKTANFLHLKNQRLGQSGHAPILQDIQFCNIDLLSFPGSARHLGHKKGHSNFADRNGPFFSLRNLGDLKSSTPNNSRNPMAYNLARNLSGDHRLV